MHLSPVQRQVEAVIQAVQSEERRKTGLPPCATQPTWTAPFETLPEAYGSHTEECLTGKYPAVTEPKALGGLLELVIDRVLSKVHPHALRGVTVCR